MRYLRDPQVVLTALCALFLVLGFFHLHPAIPYISVAFGSYFALTSAWSSVRNREVDVNLLMVVAAIGAVAVGNPLDAAALLFLFSLSSTLESLTMARTRSAIEALVQLRPDKAIRVDPDGDKKIPVEELVLGDRIRIPAFEAIPVDGEVVEGISTVDQSAMTGESIAVVKEPGDRLLAGTRNMDGMLLASVTSTVGNSTLDKIVSLVAEAQDNKASGERISTWFGQRYTFFVLGAFVLSFGVRVLLLKIAAGPALYESLTLLVALSPCALVISTPASTLSALAFAARKGMLIRGGEFIERAGSINTLALDKTGTLTTGRPRLVEVCLCAPAEMVARTAGGTCVEGDSCWHGSGDIPMGAAKVLAAAAAVEQYAAHPIAEAVVHAARHGGLNIAETTNHRVVPGRGAVGTVEGVRVIVGLRTLLEEEGVPITEEFIAHIEELEKSGMPMALVAYGDQLAALGFADAIREEAKEFLLDCKSLGVDRVIMLTGDTPATAERVAKEVGLTEVRGGLLPGEKSKVIQDLVTTGRNVLMVGDGINDAPALTGATIGVAMGGLGSDIAMNSADVVLMHDRLDRIPLLIRLGRQTNTIIRTNLFFASGVIVTLTVFSMLGRLPLPIAVVGHEGSTVLVILNGLRLLRGPKTV
jgi:Zn2+/Cd2+-exporting ATPase